MNTASPLVRWNMIESHKGDYTGVKIMIDGNMSTDSIHNFLFEDRFDVIPNPPEETLFVFSDIETSAYTLGQIYDSRSLTGNQ